MAVSTARDQQPPDIWVSLDVTWNIVQQAKVDQIVPDPSRRIRLVRWTDGTLAEVTDESSTLLVGLNSSLIEASAAAIIELELYAPLAMLPKSREEEADDAGGEHGRAAAASSVGTPIEEDEGESKALNRKSTNKIVGRANTKERLNMIKEQGLDLPAPKVADSISSENGSGAEVVPVKRPKVDEQ